MQTDSKLIIDRIKEFETKSKNYEYSDDDVRNYFYGMIHSNLYGYARGYIFLELSQEIHDNNILLPEQYLTPIQYNLIITTPKNFKSKVAYLSHHHRNLLISVWSTFELLVTTLCNHLLPLQIKEELMHFQYFDIVKKLKLSETDDIGKDKFKLKHLTHVPISRKYNELFKLVKSNYRNRNLKSDRAFLDFMRDFRNTMHTNFIYFGTNEFKYTFKNIVFSFKPDKVVGWNDPNPLQPLLYLDIVRELTNIATEIVLAIDHKPLIPYPDLDAQRFE